MAEQVIADKFQFYSRSKNAKPGKGTGEHVRNIDEYAELEKIDNWRQILSNFSTTETIKYENLSFRSIEHAFQYKKISIVDKTAAFTFALESDSDLSKGSGQDAQKARKLRKLNSQKLAEWDSQRPAVLCELIHQKIACCPMYSKILRLTKFAELWHHVSRKPAERWIILEEIRDQSFEENISS